MTTLKTRSFKSGNSEAIRIPKSVAFGEGRELVVVRSGDVMTIYPAETTLQEMAARLAAMAKPAAIEVRDEEEIDERAGL